MSDVQYLVASSVLTILFSIVCWLVWENGFKEFFLKWRYKKKIIKIIKNLEGYDSEEEWVKNLVKHGVNDPIFAKLLHEEIKKRGGFKNGKNGRSESRAEDKGGGVGDSEGHCEVEGRRVFQEGAFDYDGGASERDGGVSKYFG